jgi:hypothetical protein
MYQSTHIYLYFYTCTYRSPEVVINITDTTENTEITKNSAVCVPSFVRFVISIIVSMGGMFWIFIVGLFCYICIFRYLYVDSLTYAFGWSAFLCRIKFCDTLVVKSFLSKHHHHHHQVCSIRVIKEFLTCNSI